jgi:hypothetical protein
LIGKLSTNKFQDTCCIPHNNTGTCQKGVRERRDNGTYDLGEKTEEEYLYIFLFIFPEEFAGQIVSLWIDNRPESS